MQPSYRKLDTTDQSIRYQLAKTLAVSSLASTVLLSFAALFYTSTFCFVQVYPILLFLLTHLFVFIASRSHHSSGAISHYNAFQCSLPPKLMLPMSEDETYTPPDPDPSLRKILTFVRPEDHDIYCEQFKRLDDAEAVTNLYDHHINKECGNWQEKYTRLQNRRARQLEQLKKGDLDERNYEDRPRFIAYICSNLGQYHRSACGGLADRMMGELLELYDVRQCTIFF